MTSAKSKVEETRIARNNGIEFSADGNFRLGHEPEAVVIAIPDANDYTDTDGRVEFFITKTDLIECLQAIGIL